jgi:hypothetical protein
VAQPAPKSSTFAFFGSFAKSDSRIDSVLKGNVPAGVSSVIPFCRSSILASIKNQPAQSGNQSAQTDCDSEESAFLDSLSGAVVSASAAADTNISIDDELVFALGDSLNRAVVSTSAALDASISDIVSHDIPSSVCFLRVRISDAFLF